MGAARDVRVLNRMTDRQADSYGIEKPLSYFRVGSDKSNFAPIEGAQWYNIESVDLLNDNSAISGDSVGVCVKWTPPDPLDDITKSMTQAAVNRIAQGDCRHSPQASEWAGHMIASILNIDTDEKKGKAFMKRVLWQWEQNGCIAKVSKPVSNKGRNSPFYEVLTNV